MTTVANHRSSCEYARALADMDTHLASDVVAHAEVVAIKADIEEQTCRFIENGHCAVADLMVRATLGSPDSFRRVIR